MKTFLFTVKFVDPFSSTYFNSKCTKSSMFTMMIDGGDDEESDDEIPKELDQTVCLNDFNSIRAELFH